MNLREAISFASLIQGVGTSEGAIKGWDKRGRGRHAYHEAGMLRMPKGKDLPPSFAKPWSKDAQDARFVDPSPKSGVLRDKYTAKTPEGTTIKDGDQVRVNKELVLYNHKTGDLDKFPAGTKATVVHVLPQIGVGDQMMSVIVKNHDAEYVAAHEVSLHKAFVEPIDVQPVPKSQIQLQYKSNDGAQVTIVKTPETRDYEPRTIKELANQPSRYKGQFQSIEKVAGADGNITRVYDTSNVPSSRWGKEGPATGAPKSGVTLWVHRYDDHVTIQEQSYQRWGMKAKGRIEWKYKNIGQAFGMLKKRYGISIPLKKERF